MRFAFGKSIPKLLPQLSAASPSPKCHWPLHRKVWEGGEEWRPASQETCLNESSFRRAGCAHGAVFRCDDIGAVTRMEGTAMRCLLCNPPTPDGVHCAISAASARQACGTPATTRLTRRKRNAIDSRHVAELQLFQTMRNTSKIPAFYLCGRSCFLRVLPGAWGV